jgi:hypothetical protein
MVMAVDTDGSGQIEFNEFLGILKGGEETSGNTMGDFFKGIINGSLIEGADTLPFNLVVGFYRRQMLMNAVTGDDKKAREKGEKILRAYSKYKE